MMFQAVLFDLDDTLFKATTKTWSWTKGVMATAAEPFAGSPPPHELPALLKAKGVKVGVVTSNTRPYAEKLLAAFNVPYNVLVTGSDGFEQKPHPATLQHALKQLGVSPASAAYVGDSGEKDGVAAVLAGMQFVGAAWGSDVSLVSDAGDFHLFEPGLLLDLRAEFALAGESAEKPALHGGSVLRIDSTSYALGRHHSPGDARYERGITALVNKLKLGNGIARSAKLIRRGLRWLRDFDKWTPNYGVCIPVWAGKPARFEAVFEALRKNTDDPTGVTWLGDALNVVKPAPANYKDLGEAERRTAIKGAFAVGYQFVEGHRLVLVDDVHTTGATTDEACRVLREKGAEVRVLCIAKHQRRRIQGESCPACREGTLVLLKNTNDGSRFWGCTKFRSNGCRYTRNA